MVRALRLVGVAVVVVVSGCAGGDAPADTSPSTVAPTSPSPSEAVPEGFVAVVATVRAADGTTDELCLLVASTPEDRGRGLMGVTSLGGYDGMVFRYDAPTASSFWMKNTLLPLSIAFYDAGRFVSSTDMEPCAPDADACPVYDATGPFTDAVEVPRGELADVGLVPGSRLGVGDQPCRPADGTD